MSRNDSAAIADIFVPVIGQYDNIGDIILRRPLIAWLRSAGRLHLYVGHAPRGFTEGLGIKAEDRAYESFIDWYIAGLLATTRGKACYMFKPGEIQLTLPGMREHVSMLPLLLWLRLRGGRIARIGSGARNVAALPRLILWPSLAVSQLILWRDARTAAYLRVGGVMPDLAFSEGDSSEVALRPAARALLVVSMRGDRPTASQPWIDGVRGFARSMGLDVHVVTQVARDARVSAALAAALGAELLSWDGTGHAQQEALLRAVYRRTRVVVSDRLHVLIAAYTHGAMPVAALTDASDKIARHFAAADIHGVAFQAAGLDSAAIASQIEAIVARGPSILARLPAVRAELQLVRERVATLLAAPATW